MWVQRPILLKRSKRGPVVAQDGGARARFMVNGSLSVRPFRVSKPGKDIHAKSQKDRLKVDVILVRKDSVTPANRGRPLSTFSDDELLYSDTVTRRPADNKTVSFSVELPKNIGRRLAKLSAKKQQYRIAVFATHEKDTFADTNGHDYTYLVPGNMTKKQLNNKGARRVAKRNARVAREFEHSADVNSAGRVSATDLSELYVVEASVINNTPFQQVANFNQNIACMSVPSNFGPQNTTMNPMTGTTTLGSPDASGQWYGSASGNPPGSSSVSGAVEALSQAGLSAVNSLQSSALSTATYSETGLETAVASAGLSFVVNLIEDLITDLNGCNNYGQYFGVNATVSEIPTTIDGNPQAWATASDQSGSSYEAGSQSSAVAPDTLPDAGSSNYEALQAILKNAYGQATTGTYFNNGGMPAPIADVPDNSTWNGNASWSQGLIQYPYPNPGVCLNNNCDTGQIQIQLGYLVNGYDAPFGPVLTQLPTATAQVTTDPNDASQEQVEITCNVVPNGTFTSPFGGTSGSPSLGNSTNLASIVANDQQVTDANYTIGFYAQDSDGNYIYNSDLLDTEQFPGPLTPTASNPPLISLQARPTTVDFNQATVTASGTLSESDISEFVDVNGNPATVEQYGCTVAGFISWSGMNIISGGVWGQNWPFPQVQTGGPLSSNIQNTFNWPNPVNNINLSWAGDTYTSSPVPAPSL